MVKIVIGAGMRNGNILRCGGLFNAARGRGKQEKYLRLNEPSCSAAGVNGFLKEEINLLNVRIFKFDKYTWERYIFFVKFHLKRSHP